MKRIAELLKQEYCLNVDISDDTHIYADNDFIKCVVVSPHEGTHYKWFIRFSTVAAFDRWNNSSAVQGYFGTEEKLIKHLKENQIGIYMQLIKYLSHQYDDVVSELELNYK